MSYLVDVVNLNADASCLSSKWWLKMLGGKSDSYFYKWLDGYVKSKKKVSLGLTGATVADISMHNPEAIQLINNHRDIFEIILRPFSHDIGLLRSTDGFRLNLETGIKTLKKEFGKYENYFLPPEFMITNEQILILKEHGVSGTFINASRFKKEINDRLPEKPYHVKGLMNVELKCIPFHGQLTSAYLQGIHFFNADEWNKLLKKTSQVQFSWRDGESSFFVPHGNERELSWLRSEDKAIERLFLSESMKHVKFDNNTNLKENHYHYYPVHSFTPWMKEFRMIGFIQKVMQAEQDILKHRKEKKALWLQVINSDILSSIEKDSPVISIRFTKDAEEPVLHTIWRCERGLEGEEFLSMFKGDLKKTAVSKYLDESKSQHIVKLQARLKYLKGIL